MIFTDEDIKKFQPIRPDLCDDQIEEVMSFICDQISNGGCCFKNITDEQVFESAADYVFPKGE